MSSQDTPHQDSEPGRLFTVNEAAVYLSLHPGSVRRLVRSGTLAASRVGQGPKGRLRIRQQDLDALLTDSQQGTAPNQEGGQ